MSQAIEEKSANNLDAIPVNNIPKEIWPIVNSLNLLLKQIDNSLESERNFTANAAHELLTPLAAIKTEVQLLLRQNQTPQGSAPIDYSTSLLEINSRLDRATHTVEQLVLLSRYDSENQNGDIDNQATNIRDLVQEEISALGGKIEEKAIAFSFVEHPLTPEANNKDFVFEGNKIATTNFMSKFIRQRRAIYARSGLTSTFQFLVLTMKLCLRLATVQKLFLSYYRLGYLSDLLEDQALVN